MKRILYLIIPMLLLLNRSAAQAVGYTSLFEEVFEGPDQNKDYQAWHMSMDQWRETTRRSIDYDSSQYNNRELEWINSSFIYVQMMAHDRYFYDPLSSTYTVDRYLEDLEQRYGGIDAVLIWPTYPNIGIDNRNQFDLLHDMPGGIEGVKKMIGDFHSKGVKVFFPIMIWDNGTRKIDLPMALALVKEMKRLGADGLNGDTMFGVTREFMAAADSLDYPLIFQPELSIGSPQKFTQKKETDTLEGDGVSKLKPIEWNLSSWGYFFPYESITPGVSVYKWLEPSHQVFVTNRWARDKTDDLQHAFFNGIGYNAWENIWGVWNQITERDAAAIKRISTIYRSFPQIWKSKQWRPYVPTLQSRVYASEFPGNDRTIYTLINRDSIPREGVQLELPNKKGALYYDIWNGKVLQPEKKGNKVLLNFPIEAHGYGAVLEILKESVDGTIDSFLKKMHDFSNRPLSSFSRKWGPLPQKMVEIQGTSPVLDIPEGMIYVPENNHYEFISNGVMIEGNDLPTAVGIQHPWEKHPARSQQHLMSIKAFYIDKYPVTNEQYKSFMDATGYEPEDKHNFLKDWDNGTYPEGWANKPVTWVSIEDARAYAKWAGKRLPHEWEWQYAAQGGNKDVLYPWGSIMDTSRIPPIDSTRTSRSVTDVNIFPQGASSLEIMDLTGNIWQWTDEYRDEHTRAAVLKGGGFYRSATSDWYFPRAYELNKYGKYLLMAPSMDRSATIGFRCVADTP
ncbi:SUMF1/EgtB/PvdO family nonheme iron enzyme [Galbibacter sp. PAP.153]|uniref:formylglycine-generating enzyme family protein n=1 Tax=Galbibacter sp. PAP.153 TaxID=3104623 RepID=UPI00300819F9